MHALLRHLPHFGPSVGGPAYPAAPSVGPASHPSPPALPKHPPAAPIEVRAEAQRLFTAEDMAHARAEARRQAEADAQQAHEALEQIRADDAARFSQELMDMRELWCRAEAERLSEGFRAALSDLEGRLSEAVAAVLRPFIGEKVRERAVADLAARLSARLAQGGPALEVSGAPDLLAALSARLGAAAGIAFLPSDAADVKVVSEDTVMETQIATWAALLAKAEGGADVR